MNTQFLARIALFRDCDKPAVYRNTLTASYAIYQEGGGIIRIWCVNIQEMTTQREDNHIILFRHEHLTQQAVF